MIIGNHRDAWGYGASDPSSGTAALMEMARVLGARVRAGWRPRRSIVLASWVAEEAGLPRAARFVGSVLKRFINDDEVPWFRVLGSDGTIRVTGGTARDQAQLLRAEGVEVKRGRVDLEACGWRP